MKGPTKNIQGRSLDLYDVVGVVRSARADLMFERNGEDYVFTHCFSYATDLVPLFNVEPSSPRTAVRQSHRVNAAAETPFQYWLSNAYLPFLDHIIMEVDSKLSTEFLD